MEPTQKLVSFLLDVELALDMASTGQYFTHMRHEVRIWKVMGYGEYFIRILLSRLFRFIDSPTEMCMRVSLEGLKINSDALQRAMKHIEPERRFTHQKDKRIFRTQSLPNIGCYKNKLKGIQNHPLIVEGYINAKFTKLILDLVQAIFEKMGDIDNQKVYKLGRKNIRLESAFERSHTQLEKMVSRFSHHPAHQGENQLRIYVDDSPPIGTQLARRSSF